MLSGNKRGPHRRLPAKRSASNSSQLSFFGLKKDPDGNTIGYVERVIMRGREIVAVR
jgi:hypothetical protein